IWVLPSSSTVISIAVFVTVARSTATGRGQSIQPAAPMTPTNTAAPAVRFSQVERISISCLEDSYQIQAVHAAANNESRKDSRDDHDHARRGIGGRLHDQTDAHQLAGQIGFHHPREPIAHGPSGRLGD